MAVISYGQWDWQKCKEQDSGGGPQLGPIYEFNFKMYVVAQQIRRIRTQMAEIEGTLLFIWFPSFVVLPAAWLEAISTSVHGVDADQEPCCSLGVRRGSLLTHLTDIAHCHSALHPSCKCI